MPQHHHPVSSIRTSNSKVFTTARLIENSDFAIQSSFRIPPYRLCHVLKKSKHRVHIPLPKAELFRTRTVKLFRYQTLPLKLCCHPDPRYGSLEHETTPLYEPTPSPSVDSLPATPTPYNLSDVSNMPTDNEVDAETQQPAGSPELNVRDVQNPHIFTCSRNHGATAVELLLCIAANTIGNPAVSHRARRQITHHVSRLRSGHTPRTRAAPVTI